MSLHYIDLDNGHETISWLEFFLNKAQWTGQVTRHWEKENLYHTRVHTHKRDVHIQSGLIPNPYSIITTSTESTIVIPLLSHTKIHLPWTHVQNETTSTERVRTRRFSKDFSVPINTEVYTETCSRREKTFVSRDRWLRRDPSERLWERTLHPTWCKRKPGWHERYLKLLIYTLTKEYISMSVYSLCLTMYRNIKTI